MHKGRPLRLGNLESFQLWGPISLTEACVVVTGHFSLPKPLLIDEWTTVLKIVLIYQGGSQHCFELIFQYIVWISSQVLNLLPSPSNKLIKSGGYVWSNKKWKTIVMIFILLLTVREGGLGRIKVVWFGVL